MMGNQNTNSNQSNRVVRTGLFRGLNMLANATDFVLTRRCYSPFPSGDAPPSKRLCRRSNRKRKVRFNDKVQVRTIEHHSSYAEEERKAMWRSKEEIKVHVLRSRFERKWENKDWCNAPEKSDMLWDVRHGIRYHPCWTIPRKPYHTGEMLYGRGNKRASYNRHLLGFMRKYGNSAFVQEK
jgi:hypothetical protein